VRVGALAGALKLHKSTVVAMIKRLVAAGWVTHARYGLITLTPAGEAIAGRTGARHDLIREVLVQLLLLEEQDADANACRLEHALDETAHQRLRAAARCAAEQPALAARWRRAFTSFLAAAAQPAPTPRLSRKGGA
jgi:DtxR family Mn-dependent transcriptional regulator